MTAGGTVTFLNKLTDLAIFEVQQTPAFINNVQLRLRGVRYILFSM